MAASASDDSGSVGEPGSYSENDASDVTSGAGGSSSESGDAGGGLEAAAAEKRAAGSLVAAREARNASTGRNASAPTAEEIEADDDTAALLAGIRMPAEMGDGEEERSGFHIVNPMLPPFSAEGDAQLLAESLGMVKGKKKNELQLVDLLTTRMPEEVQAARAVFNATQKKPLSKMVAKRTRRSFKRLLCGLVLSPAEYDAQQLINACSGLGTKESVLIDVLTTRSNAQIAAINEELLRSVSKPLERLVKKETGGKFKKLMAELAKGRREEDDAPLDLEAVHSDAVALFESLEDGSSTDGLVRIFGRRSHKHLKALARHYRKVTQQVHRRGQSITHHFDELIESKLKGDFRTAIKALINPEEYLATNVRNAVVGLGTDDKLLRRAILGARLTPIRLHLAKHAYFRLYGRALVRDIEQDSSGNYRKAFRRLCATHTGNFLAVLLRENMRHSFHGIGTSKAKVSHVLTEACRNARERADVGDAYVLDYGRKLEKSLKTELSGNHAKFLIALSTRRAVLDAKTVSKAKKKSLIDVFTTRRPFEIERIKVEFARMYEKELEDFLTSKLSGVFRKVMLGLLDVNRTDGRTITDAKADELAQQLYVAGEKKKLGTRSDVFVHLCTAYSPQDLAAVDVAYERLRNKRLTVAIAKEFSGDTKRALQACVDPVAYVAEQLYKSMKGLGTDDSTLIRLLAHRPKAEIEAIKAAYEHTYKKTLARWIKGDTSGAYRKALLSYIADISLAPTDADAVEDGELTGSGDGMGGDDDDDVGDFEGNPDAPPPFYDDDEYGADGAGASSHRPAPVL